MPRRYNKWAGNPKGTVEDPTRCIAEVAVGGRSMIYHQCERKRKSAFDFCGIHERQRLSGKRVYVPEEQGGFNAQLSD